MKKSLYLLLLFTLSLTFFGCKEKAPVVTPDFPAKGARISVEEGENMTFRWEVAAKKAKTKNRKGVEQIETTEVEGGGVILEKYIFRLYRFDSIVEQNNGERFYFTFIKEEQRTHQALGFNALSVGTYLWEVYQLSDESIKEPIVTLSNFHVGAPSESNIEETINSLFYSYANYIALRNKDNCNDLICHFSTITNNFAHIATFNGFGKNDEAKDFGIATDNNSNGTNSDGSPCILMKNPTTIYANFSVSVPRKKLSHISPITIIKTYLFKGQEMIENSEDNIDEYSFSSEYILNKDYTDSREYLNLSRDNYLKYCQDFNIIKEFDVYKADIRLKIKFKPTSNENYTLVFFIPKDTTHFHYSLISMANLGEGLKTKVEPSPFVRHIHSIGSSCSAESICPVDASKLSYYTCRDTIACHLAKHIIAVPLEICADITE